MDQDRSILDRTGGRMHALQGWIDDRFPMTKLWNEHVARYYAPKNFNFWYFFGSLLLLVFVNQILTGIFLAMSYQPTPDHAFASIQYIMRDVQWGWLIRYMHVVGASAFFVLIYLHMFRGLMYGSYKQPRELLWVFGMLLYLSLMAEAFMGYLLPWGQMSYWGAQVIISLFGALPGIGPGLEQWIRGDFYVSGATLNRFFAMHVALMPLILVGLVLFHIMALHEVGSNNPDGVEIKDKKDDEGKPLDGIPFHPYYTVKDMTGVVVFVAIFSIVLFYAPTLRGLFLEPDNFSPANALQTPPDIHPLWYFTPFYSMLRSIPNKLGGVLTMGGAIGLLFLMPWIDKNPIKSLRYRPIIYKALLLAFAASFFALGIIGLQHPTAFWAKLAQRFTELYYSFFVISWLYSRSRPRRTFIITFFVLLALVTLFDVMTYAPQLASTFAWTWLIPAGYYVVFLLLPAFIPKINVPKPVPERVTEVE